MMNFKLDYKYIMKDFLLNIGAFIVVSPIAYLLGKIHSFSSFLTLFVSWTINWYVYSIIFLGKLKKYRIEIEKERTSDKNV